MDKGYLGDLPVWLYSQAKGAYLNYRMADGRLTRQFSNAGLSDVKTRKLVSGVSHAISWSNFSEVVKVDGNFNILELRLKRNAWRMLDHIIRRDQ